MGPSFSLVGARLAATSILIGLLLMCVTAPAFAQGHVIAPAPRVDPNPGVLTSFNFHLDAAFLSIDDPRFSWDADFGGDLDLVDFGRGRVNFFANYEAILGSPLKSTDPNQGNYTLDGLVSWRVRRVEISGIFHHVSRHLSDRVKDFPIDWNSVGLGVGHTTATPRWRVDSQVRLAHTIKTSHVDYNWELWFQLAAERHVHDRVIGAVRGHASIVTIDPTVSNRERQGGAGLEAALRLVGNGAAVELVFGVEQRIDADPIDRTPRRWMHAGFRLLGR